MKKQKQRTIVPPQDIIQIYNAGTKRGPPVLSDEADFDFNNVSKIAKVKDLVWILVRHENRKSQCIPSWTGFNIMTRDQEIVSEDKLGYLPTINAPATNLSTVNEVLMQSLSIAKKLALEDIAVCFDQALYSKACEIVWKEPEKLRPVVLTMGTFHTICNLMSIIGKRFTDAGLRDIAVESGVLAEGSVDAALESRQYNRAVHLHKLVYEALLRMAFKGFLPWLEENHLDALPDFEELLEKVPSPILNQEVLTSLLCSTVILDHFLTYLDYLRSANGNLSGFWMTYIDLVDILLGLLRASREGNWHLHLEMIRRMIPWCFAYDRQNYAKYLPLYLRDMIRLQEDHAPLYNHFKNGGFVTQLGDANTFGKIAIDQAIEETANKDTQTPGGTKGFSLKPGALSRFYITAEYRSMCLRQLRKMTSLQQTMKIKRADLSSSRIAQDERDVQAIVDLLETSWKNPFEGTNELISLLTGKIAAKDIESDLMDAEKKGKRSYQDFKTERLQSTGKKFHDRLPKLQLKTFSNLQKTTKRKIKSSKEVILKADHKLFGHMVLIAGSRNLDMKEVFQHPLGPIPWALANCDGTLKKTSKSA